MANLKEYNDTRVAYQSGNTRVKQNYPDEELFTLDEGVGTKHRTLTVDAELMVTLYPPTDNFTLEEN